MTVDEAQREMRSVFQGGYIGQAVSGILWLISAALGTWVSTGLGIVSLFIGGMLIYPLTQLTLRLAGRQASLSSGNPLQQLAQQIAFIVPLCIPVIAAATLYNVNWYYPAFMIVVGAHYLPFVFLYGMWHYALLTALLIGGGVAIGYTMPESFSVGGWVTGALLVIFAVVVSRIWSRHQKAG